MPKVLVVDDSLSVRKVVEKALEARGLQVLAAASGAEAIQMLERDRPDVVICDVILPDRDGFQIVAVMDESHEDQPRDEGGTGR